VHISSLSYLWYKAPEKMGINMKYLGLFLGQATLILSLVLLSRAQFDSASWHHLPRFLRIPSIRRTLRSFRDTLRLILALTATLHICIFISHKLLLRYFGVTFSPQVWQHVDSATLELAVRSRPWSTTLAALVLLVLPALYLTLTQKIARLLQHPSPLSLIPASVAALSGYVFLYVNKPQLPSRLFFETAHASLFKPEQDTRALSDDEKNFLRAHGVAHLSEGQVRFTALKPNPMARNLIVVYLEAFDVLYTNISPKGFKNLTPTLNALAKESTVFRHWYPAGGWTIGALFGSHCGTQLDPGSTNGNAYLVEKFAAHSPLVCLPDILKQAGFKTSFMGGASPRFSGKGDFLKSNGYDEVIGREWFENSNELKTKMLDWGLLDWELFNEAAEKAIAMHAAQERFLLTVLTLNTHQPGYPQPSVCKPFPPEAGTDPLRTAAACTDKALQNFLNKLEEAGVLEDTAVWLQSDHPQFETELKKNALGVENVSNKELVSILRLPDTRTGTLVESPATAFDFPASALDVLGVATTGRFQRGVSVFSPAFKSRTAVASAFGFHGELPAPPALDDEFLSAHAHCSPSTPNATLPKPWSPCAFATLNHLASLDQQRQHARPASLLQALKDLRFELNPSDNSPIAYLASDPSRPNLLLHISEYEAADTQTEVRPYILEFSHSGELLSTRKLQFNQEQECQHREALVNVVFENQNVVVRNCSGGRDVSKLKLTRSTTAKLPL
jgi:hypothetical protein